MAKVVLEDLQGPFRGFQTPFGKLGPVVPPVFPSLTPNSLKFISLISQAYDQIHCFFSPTIYLNMKTHFTFYNSEALFTAERRGKRFVRALTSPGGSVNAVEWRSTLHKQGWEEHLASVFKAVASLRAFGIHCVSPQWGVRGHPVDRSWTFQLGYFSALRTLELQNVPKALKSSGVRWVFIHPVN